MSWANDQMLAPCRELTDEQLTTETAGTYGPLSQTLVHLARAQGGYLTTLTGWRPDAKHRLELGAPFPGVHRIADYLRFTGGRLIEWRAMPRRIVSLRASGMEHRSDTPNG